MRDNVCRFLVYSVNRAEAACGQVQGCGYLRWDDTVGFRIYFHIFAIHSREYYYWSAVKGARVFPMKYAALSRNVPREAALSRVSAFSSEPKWLIKQNFT